VTPYWQCFTCGHYICNDDYINLQETTGSDIPKCLECQGDLVSLPGQCQGCKSYVLDVLLLNKATSCLFCGHNIQSFGRNPLLSPIKARDRNLPKQIENDYFSTEKK